MTYFRSLFTVMFRNSAIFQLQSKIGQQVISTTAVPCCFTAYPRSDLGNRNSNANISDDRLSRAPNSVFQRNLAKLRHDVEATQRVTLHEVKQVLASLSLNDVVAPANGCVLLSFCGRFMAMESASAKAELLFEIISLLSSRGVLNIQHFNYVLACYRDNHYKYCCFDFLKLLRKQNIEPNQETYALLIASVCEFGDIDIVGNLLAEMQESNMSVTKAVFLSLIMVYAQFRLPDEIERTLNLMQQAEIAVDASTYAALARGCAFSGDIFAVKQSLQLATDLGPLQPQEYVEIIYALCVGSAEDFEKLLSSVPDGIFDDFAAYQLLLLLVSEHRYDVALKLLEKLLSLSNGTPIFSKWGVQPSQSTVIFIMVQQEAPVSIVKSFCDMLDISDATGIKCLFSCALLYAVAQRKLDYAQRIILFASEQKLDLKPQYYWPLVLLYSRERKIQELTEILTDMKQSLGKVDYETLEGWIVPYINLDVKDLLAITNALDIPRSTTVAAYVNFYLRTYNNDAFNMLLSEYGSCVSEFVPSVRNKLALAIAHMNHFLEYDYNTFLQLLANLQIAIEEVEQLTDFIYVKDVAKIRGCAF